MKVGILTHHYPENRNYGAMLQLYALYYTLEKLGFIPYVINYEFLKKSNKSFKTQFKDYLIEKFATAPFSEFSNKYLPNKTIKVNKANAASLNNYLDAFIVGSDQVWRYSYVPNIENFFLDFVNDSHLKISYAASFGIDKWDNDDISIYENVKKLINKFDAISVREQSGLKICQEFGVEAQLVLDPVFLLDQSVYKALINDKIKKYKKTESKTIAAMVLDDSIANQDFINQFSKYYFLKIKKLSNLKLSIFGKDIPFYYSINKWLSIIEQSDFVITDSFHCVAFCIIFRKNFLCIKNSNRGAARLESLLGLLGLKERFIDLDSSKLNYDNFEYSIDYSYAEKKIESMKQFSMEFIIQNLNIQK